MKEEPAALKPPKSRINRTHLVVLTLWAAVLMASPLSAEAFPSCGMLAGPSCNGPFFFSSLTVDSRYFTGSNCVSGCTATAGNAYNCAAFSMNPIRAYFLKSTDTSVMYCDFNCGTRGSCTIRGGDGLPVELLGFGVD